MPDEESEEWEAEYRRQFELAKQRQTAAGARPDAAAPRAPAPAAPPPDPTGWAELTGAPTQIRWAAALRSERIGEIRDPAVLDWLATTWTKAKSWIDTSGLRDPGVLAAHRPPLCRVPERG